MSVTLLLAVVLVLGVLLRPVAAEAAAGDRVGRMKVLVRAAAQTEGVSAALALAIVQVESSFDPAAKNPEDPSYGLGQVQPAWFRFYGFDTNEASMLDPALNARVTCRIIRYFMERGFEFPSEADIYNVGETYWARGMRNVAYRDRVEAAYRSFVRAGSEPVTVGS